MEPKKVMFTKSVAVIPRRRGIYKNIMDDIAGFSLLVVKEEAECKEPERLSCKGCPSFKSCKLLDKSSCTQPDRDSCEGCPDADKCTVGKSVSKKKPIRRQRKWGDDPEYDEVMRNFGMFGKEGEDVDQRLVFGWANVALKEDGTPPEDCQGDIIPPEELEAAAYNFVLSHGIANQEHMWGTECGWLVESMMFTKDKMTAMGIPEGTLPEGWFVGFYVPDPDVYEKVKSGEYNMFSIEGTGRRIPLEPKEDPDEDNNATPKDVYGYYW
ncbi:XkdF-like putative serine protease domain-containing protein [uncultured Duncaniella sp.]|uniref:XkdF-like putative serine protease domain-containing protein n=1 Tax=uncultured Duncaniella sp. TaxID=2768039 RepID=UPI0026305C65|nr:XkdF-like putative serine protease domain-containing protein [uncultured Duncaniella sp.]